jgi:uncharacterized membrane protein YcaP (DUF421 family)
MLLLIIRTLMLYFLILFMMKIMGKRQIGQLQPFELVVVLIFSELASSAMDNTASPILNSIIPIIVIAIIQVALAIINLKNEKLRDYIYGKPSIVISQGKIMEEEMRNLRMNINDLQEQLRSKGFFDISEIEFAIMETNGQISVMSKTPKRPVQVADLDLKIKQEQPAMILVLDGKINYDALKSMNKDQNWLMAKLKAQGNKNIQDIFIASINDGTLFIQTKENKTQSSQGQVSK